MTLNPALTKTLLMAASIGMVVPLLAAPPPGKKDPAVSTAKPATAEPEPVIPGATVARAGGGFLGLTAGDGHFKLSFYDAKKKAAPVDVARALARWGPLNRTGDDRAVLNPAADGQALIGATYVRPPFRFKVYLTLMGADGKSLESYVVDFRG